MKKKKKKVEFSQNIVSIRWISTLWYV